MNNHKDALTQGLVLAITAPTDKHCDMAMELVNQIAKYLSPEEVKACQMQALDLALDTDLG